MLFRNLWVLLIIFSVLFVMSCRKKTEDSPTEAEATRGTPVTLTSVTVGPLSETIELNATSVFQLKTFLKANTTGYLKNVNAHVGQFINKGQEIFTIKTKEAEALGNTINQLDSSFRFNGIVRVRAPANGYVDSLSYQSGDYVQDGEQLAVISDRNSFGFVLDLPYELKPYLNNNKNVQLRLPDGMVLQGYVASILPTVDPVSQTQKILIKVNGAQQIPEHLIAKITLIKNSKPKAVFLPKDAILTDEVQTEFWVMKLIDSTTAIKVPIQKGLENGFQVEILSPAFSESDKILLTGNYGLTDTASVLIVH
ncbi:MAG: efflux RND transporter periplasmic adaptor subunit [Saprospiraceae bacterium]